MSENKDSQDEHKKKSEGQPLGLEKKRQEQEAKEKKERTEQEIQRLEAEAAEEERKRKQAAAEAAKRMAQAAQAGARAREAALAAARGKDSKPEIGGGGVLLSDGKPTVLSTDGLKDFCKLKNPNWTYTPSGKPEDGITIKTDKGQTFKVTPREVIFDKKLDTKDKNSIGEFSKNFAEILKVASLNQNIYLFHPNPVIRKAMDDACKSQGLSVNKMFEKQEESQQGLVEQTATSKRNRPGAIPSPYARPRPPGYDKE